MGLTKLGTCHDSFGIKSQCWHHTIEKSRAWTSTRCMIDLSNLVSGHTDDILCTFISYLLCGYVIGSRHFDTLLRVCEDGMEGDG